MAAPRTSISSVELAVLDAIGFRSMEYVGRYSDLMAASLDERTGARHYLEWGVYEQRLAPFQSTLAGALDAVERAQVAEPLRTALIRALALSRAAEAGTNGDRPEVLADALVPSDCFRPLLVFGDSHAPFYNEPKLISEGGHWLPLPFVCWAGSARGLADPRSRSGYGTRILSFLRTVRSGVESSAAVLLFKFGQVDIEFVYNFKRLDLGETRFDEAHYRAFMQDTAAQYFRFLESVRREVSPATPLAVASVFPPALSDEAIREGYVNAHVSQLEGPSGDLETLAAAIRKLEMPDWHTRTRYHRAFGEELRRLCDGAGFEFVDNVEPFACPGGVVRPEFISMHGGSDHHLSPTPETRRAICAIGTRLVRRLDRGR